MTPAEIKAARKAANLTQQQAADLIGVTVQAWRHWEQGLRHITKPHRKLIQLMCANVLTPSTNYHPTAEMNETET